MLLGFSLSFALFTTFVSSVKFQDSPNNLSVYLSGKGQSEKSSHDNFLKLSHLPIFLTQKEFYKHSNRENHYHYTYLSALFHPPITL